MKTAEQWMTNESVEAAIPDALEGITMRNAYINIVRMAQDEAKLEGIRLGLEAAAQQCNGVPALRQAFTTDKNKDSGIKHAVNLCEAHIRALSPTDIAKEA